MGFYTESAKELISNPLSAPEFLMECNRIDRAIFEGMIELDFAEAYSANGTIFLEEGEEEAGKKAADDANDKAGESIWKAFIDALKSAFDRVKEALEKFFSQILSVVKTKVINDEKAGKCEETDIWCFDYLDKVEPLTKLSALKDLITKETEIQTRLQSAKEGEVSGIKEELSNLANEYKERLEEYTKYKIDKAENEKSDSKYQLPVTKLGDHKSEFTKMQQALSPAGVASCISATFDKLKTPFDMRSESNKYATSEQKNVARIIKQKISSLKLDLFNATAKVVMNFLKLAWRNYRLIYNFVKGKAKAENTDKAAGAENKAAQGTTNNNVIGSALAKNQESAFLVAAYADLFCESVFGI